MSLDNIEDYSPKEKQHIVKLLLNRVIFNLFDKNFYINVEIDKKHGQRLYIQVKYHDKCRETGQNKEWSGRKWYLSDHMTADEVIKTSYAACKAVVEHEIMEGFTVDGKVLFNPHVNFEELLKVSEHEIRRA